jgi:hypothetical protein
MSLIAGRGLIPGHGLIAGRGLIPGHGLIAGHGSLAVESQNFTGAQFVQGLIVCAVIGAVIVVAFAILYLKYNSRPVKGPELLHEPPADLPPAIVDALFTSAPTPAKMVATLLDLERRGVVVMSKVHSADPEGAKWTRQGDRALHLCRDRLAPLTALERDFVYELFDHIGRGADDILLSTLREWWETHPATATIVAGYWGLQVRREAEWRGLLKPNVEGRSWLTSIGVVTALSPWLIAFAAQDPGGKAIGVAGFATLFPLGAVLAAWAQRMTALTAKGCELAGGYEALRRYLETFGRMKEKPAEAVVLWEQYLTLAVVLGLASETVDELYIMPPSFLEYGRAGHLGRRAYGFVRSARFPDADEADAYAAFRRSYDATLPEAHVAHGKTDQVVFHPLLDLAGRSPFARHGIAGVRL